METCEELRSLSAQGGLSSYATIPGKYSFIHKIIDGITVLVNVVNIKFNSPAFIATVQVSFTRNKYKFILGLSTFRYLK